MLQRQDSLSTSLEPRPTCRSPDIDVDFLPTHPAEQESVGDAQRRCHHLALRASLRPHVIGLQSDVHWLNFHTLFFNKGASC